MSRRIPLSKGLFAIVDDEDYEAVLEFKWSAHSAAHTAYAVRQLRTPGGANRHEALHTWLTRWALVDHINGDGLDNRRANLREATPRQNQANRRKSSVSGQPFKGTRELPSGRWQAYIRDPRKRPDADGKVGKRAVGTFASAEHAARAYDDAAREIHGEFAALNFPRPGERSALTGEIE